MNRTEFEQVVSVATTFFGVLLAVLFAIGVTAGDSLKGPQAFARRWTLITLAVAISASVAWLRRKLMRRAMTPARAAPPIRTPDRFSAPPAAKTSAAVAAAARQAIVFRQHVPPRHDRTTLSFFGGAPVAPRGFRWPRSKGTGTESKPLDFLMQIDCAAVPAAARLGMLPDHGVLYFFHDLTWGQQEAFRVIHQQGGNDWVEIPPPADLGPAYGRHAADVWKWTQSLEDCPRLLPRWTFQPAVVEIPAEPHQPDEPDAPFLWPGEKTMAGALKAAQGEEVVSRPFSTRDLIGSDNTLRRPFANYPHDWRAVQIGSGLLLERVDKPNRLPSTFELRDLPEADRTATLTRIRDDAWSWYNRAKSHVPFEAVPQSESDQFWRWLADMVWLVRFVIGDALTMSIEASLGHSSEAAARIPDDAARRVHDRHALAVSHENRLFASTPDRMLAPPVDVQGHQWERAKTSLLLLELSTNEGLGHHFGEGVYQFWIAPSDLAAGRFDQVELTADAY